MLGPSNKQFGQACVSQVTGTAAWMDVVSTQYLLGVRPTLKGLVLDPCIPRGWKQFSVRRVYRGCALQIDVLNPNGVCGGVKSFIINGKKTDGNIIYPETISGLADATVEIVLGE